ncbi:MAG: PEP-CTERM sorting domain-containing protein [Phycisphaeraceae bacterium]|nr:PEP-CTERM sorting domain-containing protein [Phycisphaeraceae bacterium]
MMRFVQRFRWKMGTLAVGLLAVGMAGQVMADYANYVSSQNPILYFRMNEATNPGAPLPALVDNTASISAVNSANPGIDLVFGETSGNALTPAGGFDGFESGNSWVYFPTGVGGVAVAGSVVTTLTNPRAALDYTAGSSSMWFRTDTAWNWGGGVYGTLWAGDDGASGNMDLKMYYTPDANNGKIYMDIVHGTTTITAVTSTSTYTDNQWHHVAATWYRDVTSGDGGIAVYIDGGAAQGGETLINTYTAWDATITKDFSVRSRFGKQATNATEFQGYIDEFAIWNTTLDATAIENQYLSAFGTVLHPGDANGDGLVNLSDLQILGDNWQSNTATWAEADFTGDGIVNLADLQILGDNWGFGVGPDTAFDEALAQVSIPEPATMLMLGVGGLLAIYRRK